MKTIDILQETYSALLSNKVRTGLTMLGIVIGISSVIAMVSIGKGAQSTIETNIQSIGSNLIQVIPGVQGGAGSQVSQGRGTAKTLTYDDALNIKEKISSIKAVAPELSGRYQITGKGTNTNTSVVGVTADYSDVRNISIAEGSFISEQHFRGMSKVAVLGPTTRDDLFGEGVYVIGQNIRINNIQFKIIGVTTSKGGSGFLNQDDRVFIPLTSAQKFLAGDPYLSNISVQVLDNSLMAESQIQITNLLLELHNISDKAQPDFSILNQNDIVATASSITQTFTILLGAVAGISLLVGGIGIMNMMLTTVTERTREIGLRKAIGAKRKDINLQFLIEAVVITLLGGIIGVLLGSIASFFINLSGLIQTKISLNSILLAFSVSAVIGVAFGYYPARRASNLNPIDALRYE
ncbi:MAG: ABC transporter permease [Candidatus Pacebacteria bacterium]|nr:ABC transporter permease [Candidatus Paceibacterota bacterium]MCF7862819.1 ABC transporter permease [Candidatus Paceibacterota bacterium]